MQLGAERQKRDDILSHNYSRKIENMRKKLKHFFDEVNYIAYAEIFWETASPKKMFFCFFIESIDPRQQLVKLFRRGAANSQVLFLIYLLVISAKYTI